MKHKAAIPEQERRARSEAAQVLSWKDFIFGGLVSMKRVCGKPNCKCTRGKKHVSLYLACKYRGKRKMICIPKDIEKTVSSGVKNYAQCKRLMKAISDSCVKRLMKQKKD